MTPLQKLHHTAFILGQYLAPAVNIWIREAL